MWYHHHRAIVRGLFAKTIVSMTHVNTAKGGEERMPPVKRRRGSRHHLYVASLVSSVASTTPLAAFVRRKVPLRSSLMFLGSAWQAVCASYSYRISPLRVKGGEAFATIRVVGEICCYTTAPLLRAWANGVPNGVCDAAPAARLVADTYAHNRPLLPLPARRNHQTSRLPRSR